MNSSEWIQKLEGEGYQGVTEVTHDANKVIPLHTHDVQTVHVITDGEMTLFEIEKVLTLKKGDRFDIPAGTTHHVKIGPTNCTVIVGVKS